MQGDVISPLVSSNMVDENISKMAVATQKFYMYKYRVPIPPLLMQDDTLAISIRVKMPRKNNGLFDVRNLLFLAAYCGQL